MKKILSLLLLALLASSNPLLANSDQYVERALKRSLSAPLGLPKLNYNKENTPTKEKIALGKKLFFDKRLSADNSLSCAGCHMPSQGFTETNKATPFGIDKQVGKRNTPSLFNVAYYKRLHMDGRETALETQYIFPLTSPHEMGARSVGYVIQKIKWLPDYDGLFEAAFGKGPSADRIGLALAAYQSTLISGNSRFDRWYYGKEKGALTPQEITGFEIFKDKGNCESCHKISDKYALFIDNAFHDIGHGWEQNHKKNKKLQDLGRYEVTRDKLDKWRYRTPTLRNIALTAPYMHNGSMKTLDEVVRFYNDGGAPHFGQDNRIEPLNLNEQEISALVAFLKSLTGDNVADLIEESKNQADKKPE